MTGGTAPDLIAVLLVTASASGANLIFRWPPKPRLPIRFSRPKPLPRGNVSGGIPAQMLIDVAYGCSHNISNELAEEIVSRAVERPETDICADEKYLWHRARSGTSSSSPAANPGANSGTFQTSVVGDTPDGGNPSCGAASGSDSGTGAPNAEAPKSVPASETPEKKARGPSSHAIYDDIIGYDAAFLADLLSPTQTMCHQKFELVVDELAFIGHPVHAKIDGSWDFAELSGQPNPSSPSVSGGNVSFNAEHDSSVVRGRVHDRPNAVAPRSYSQQPRQIFQIAADDGEEGDTEEIVPTRPRRPSLGHSKTAPRSVGPKSAYGQSASPTYRRIPSSRPFPAQLKSFHLVLVLDRPDPSSIASTDLDRYIDAYYTQFAFKLTAAMLYEQGRSNFIAQESHSLLALRDKYLVSFPLCDSPLITSKADPPTCCPFHNVDSFSRRSRPPHNPIENSISSLKGRCENQPLRPPCVQRTRRSFPPQYVK